LRGAGAPASCHGALGPDLSRALSEDEAQRCHAAARERRRAEREAIAQGSTSGVARQVSVSARSRRRGLLAEDDGDGAEEESASEGAGLTRLAASAVSGNTQPAGPEWRRGALPLRQRAMVFERPLCVALDGFTLHAATRAGGLDEEGREALLEVARYLSKPGDDLRPATLGPAPAYAELRAVCCSERSSCACSCR